MNINKKIEKLLLVLLYGWLFLIAVFGVVAGGILLIVWLPPFVGAILIVICLPMVLWSLTMNMFIKIKLKLQRLSPADFGMHKEYYRDVIQEYSPVVLSYIDNFKIGHRDIIVTLLKLKLKKCIEIKDMNNMGDICILEGSSYKTCESEEYIIPNKAGKYSLKELKRIVEKEALAKGLIQYKKYNEKKINAKIKRLILIFVLSIIGIIILAPIYADVTSDMDLYSIINAAVYIVQIGLFYPVLRIPYLILYKRNLKKEPFVRTKKGNEINEKLEGLKNYIRDYSMLKGRQSEELILWEEYLLYSVMFGQNKKVIEEFGERA